MISGSLTLLELDEVWSKTARCVVSLDHQITYLTSTIINELLGAKIVEISEDPRNTLIPTRYTPR